MLSDIEIIVCDDDPKASARDLVKPLAKNAPIPISYIVSGAGNVSICRNTLISAARGDWIAFIDDDEIAEPDWLAELLSTQARCSADVVKGFVRAIYPPGTPRWIVEGDPFTRNYGPTGTPVLNIGTGNVLFQRDFTRSKAIKFDPRFGQTGGEDTYFFYQFHTFGAYIVSSRTAIVNEIVPPSRVMPRSLSRRFRRQALSCNFPQAFSIAWSAMIGRSIFKVAACAIYPLVRYVPGSGTLGFKLFRSFWYHMGLLEGIVGRAPMTFEH